MVVGGVDLFPGSAACRAIGPDYQAGFKAQGYCHFVIAYFPADLYTDSAAAGCRRLMDVFAGGFTGRQELVGLIFL